MEPVTDLPLLPSLYLIRLETMPQRHTKELAVLKKEREQILGRAVGASVMTVIAGAFTCAYGWLSVFAWLNGAPFLISIFASLMCTVLAPSTVLLARSAIREGRAYRRKAVPNQLKAKAKFERLRIGAAKEANQDIADWNLASQGALLHDLGGCYLLPLKLQRKSLLIRIKLIERSASRASVEAVPSDP